MHADCTPALTFTFIACHHFGGRDISYPLGDDDGELAVSQLGMDATQFGVALERDLDVDCPAGPGSQRCLQANPCTLSDQ